MKAILFIAAISSGALTWSGTAVSVAPLPSCANGVRLSIKERRSDVRFGSGGRKAHGYASLDLRQVKLVRTQEKLCVQLRVAGKWRAPTKTVLILNQTGPGGPGVGDLSEKNVYVYVRRTGVSFGIAERDDEPKPLVADSTVSGSWLTLAFPTASVLPIATVGTFTWNVATERYVRGRELVDEVPSTPGDVLGFPSGKRVR
jgi:hypothetical protein